MKDIRQHFPVLAYSTYLDTAANGLVPEPVIKWRREQDDELLNNPLEYRKNTPEILKSTRQTIAEFLHASAEEVALIPNFSFGINSILEALPTDQKIAMLRDEYPSVSWPVLSRNFKTCLIDIKPDLEENILRIVETKKPDVLLFSLVQWQDGLKIDLAFLKSLKENHPKLLLIADGTQFLGTAAFDFNNSPIDIMITSAYKWLTAGFGSGFLLFKKEVQARFNLRTIGFQSADSFESPREATRFIKHFEPGHLASLNYGSIEQAIQFFNANQPKARYEHIRHLAKEAKGEFIEMGLLPRYIAERKVHSSIFNLKGDATVFKRLEQNNIACSMRGDGIRVSFHYYNSQDDLNHLVDVLKNHRKSFVL